MTVFQNRFRRGRWRYDFRVARKRYQGYCVDERTGQEAGSREEAAECERQVRRQIAEGRRRCWCSFCDAPDTERPLVAGLRGAICEPCAQAAIGDFKRGAAKP